MGACGSLLYHQPVRADQTAQQQQQEQPPQQPQQQSAPPALEAASADTAPQAQSETPAAPGKLIVTVGKSLLIDSPLNITRVTIANGQVAEAVAVNPKEVLINGTASGETSLIAAYLVSQGSTPDRAIALVRETRPGSIETDDQEAAVHEYSRRHPG